MSRPLAPWVLCLSALMAPVFPGGAAAQQPVCKARWVRTVLNDTMEMKDFQALMTLKEALAPPVRPATISVPIRASLLRARRPSGCIQRPSL